MIEKKPSLCFKYDSQDSWRADFSLELSLKMSFESKEEIEKHRQLAFLVCCLSVFFEIALGVAAFICAAVTGSSAGYAFALDCVIDTIAAALLLWRFYGASSAYSDAKERYTCISLGILFCVASVIIVTKSTYDLIEHTVTQQLMYVFILAGTGGVTNSVLAFCKYIVGKKMFSQALVLEALNTSLSAILALMLAVSEVTLFYFPSAWTIDPITSLVVAFILLLCGIRVLRERKKDPEVLPLLEEGRK